jgi:hypothetical protein
MRCIGSWDPPCIRCAKAGRRCVVVLPNRGRPRTAIASPRHSSDAPDQCEEVPDDVRYQHKETPQTGQTNGSSPAESRRELRVHPDFPRANSASHRSSYPKDTRDPPTASLPSVYSTTPIAAVEAATTQWTGRTVPGARDDYSQFWMTRRRAATGPDRDDP